MVAKVISKESFREQIAAQLRDDIVAGRYEAGEQLVERKLAGRFGVSTAPVREALMQLVHEGFLLAAPHRGVTVGEIAHGPVRSLFGNMRVSIESHALSSIFSDITEDDLSEWQQTVDDLKQACKAGDAETIAVAELSLHRLIVERAGQPELLLTWRTLAAKVRLDVPRLLEQKADLTRIHSQHATLLEKCRKKDKRAAQRALEANINFEASENSK